MAGLDVTAYWELLTPNPTPITEPINEDLSLRPPTEMDAPVNPKYGYDEKFDRIPFTGTTKHMTYMSAKSPRKRKKGRGFTPARNQKHNPQPRVRGGANSNFLDKHGLDEHSHPMDWFNAIFPMSPKDNLEDPAVANVKGDKKSVFSVSNFASYTNTKAKLVNAGQSGHIFEGKWKDFEPEDIMKMMGVYIIDGLAPSPRIIQKMQPQSSQPTHGNDKVATAIGPGYYQMYRAFRAFFACQDPLLIPPKKEKCPNAKVDELFSWCRHIWKEAWELGENFSIDEQTCRMQGKTEYKTRCGKYKRIGDGIQADCIADDGYTYDFYFRNEPPDSKWTALGFCPMHSRLLHMYENLKEESHQSKMDNLFNSVNLARAAFSLPTKVKTHGVLRKTGRGVNEVVIQEEQKGKRADAVRGTVKAAVLRGDSKSSNLIVASCYDQKPFYMISHSIEEITWVVHSKRIWSHALGRNVDFNFLRWNLSHDYNYEMNDNDVADQLRLVYRLQRMQRNQKWWWALWMWALEVSLVNAYMMLRRYCELKGVRMPYSHHDFNEKVGYALLNPDKEWPRRKSPTKSATQTPMRSTRAPKQFIRAPKFNLNALSPNKGRLNRRLDNSLTHMPVPPPGKKENHVCQLHRWAHAEKYPKKKGDENKTNTIPPGARVSVLNCKACGVILCLECFEMYHTVERLDTKIDSILSNK